MATIRVPVVPLVIFPPVRRRDKEGRWIEREYDPNNPRDVALESSIDDIRAKIAETVAQEEEKGFLTDDDLAFLDNINL